MKKRNNPILFSLGLAFALIFCLSDFTEDSIGGSKEIQETQVYDYHSNESGLSHSIKNINDLKA